jgi:diketogulonate reductase-like aldo/keto reductase
MNIERITEELNKLEITAKVYGDNYGPDSKEVKAIDRLIRELNLQVLDLMVLNTASPNVTFTHHIIIT